MVAASYLAKGGRKVPDDVLAAVAPSNSLARSATHHC
jgi:hypothetical protein